MLSQLLAFEYDVLASTSMLSLILIWGDEANNCSVTKAYCCDFGAKYAFFVVVVMFALLGFNDSFFAVYNVHPLGLSRRTFTTIDAINSGGAFVPLSTTLLTAVCSLAKFMVMAGNLAFHCK